MRERRRRRATFGRPTSSACSFGNTNHTRKADLAIELTSVLDFDVAFLYLRTEEPVQPADPTLPLIEKNDYQLVIGISLELG